VKRGLSWRAGALNTMSAARTARLATGPPNEYAENRTNDRPPRIERFDLLGLQPVLYAGGDKLRPVVAAYPGSWHNLAHAPVSGRRLPSATVHSMYPDFPTTLSDIAS
jgi:hypothetical protein